MENPTFIDEEDIPMIHQEDDEGYDNCRTPDTSRVDEALFITDATEPTSTLRLTRLRQKVKRDKINALYSHLDVTGNPDLIDLDRFRVTKDPKKGSQFSSFATATIDGSL